MFNALIVFTAFKARQRGSSRPVTDAHRASAIAQ